MEQQVSGAEDDLHLHICKALKERQRLFARVGFCSRALEMIEDCLAKRFAAK